MKITTVKQTQNFGNATQALAASYPGKSLKIADSATKLSFDPSENAIDTQIEKNGNRTYFYGDASGEITHSTTYRGDNVVKRAKIDPATKHKINEREYLKNGGWRISFFDHEGTGNIKQVAEYAKSGYLVKDEVFDPITKARLSEALNDRIDPLCYTFRKFDPKTGETIFVQTRSKDGKHGYKTESKDIPHKKIIN